MRYSLIRILLYKDPQKHYRGACETGSRAQILQRQKRKKRSTLPWKHATRTKQIEIPRKLSIIGLTSFHRIFRRVMNVSVCGCWSLCVFVIQSR